jgi:hypothetical protein
MDVIICSLVRGGNFLYSDTDKGNTVRTLSGNGTVTFSDGSSSYSDGTALFFLIEKTCGTSTRDDVTYTVSYHL